MRRSLTREAFRPVAQRTAIGSSGGMHLHSMDTSNPQARAVVGSRGKPHRECKSLKDVRHMPIIRTQTLDHQLTGELAPLPVLRLQLVGNA